MTKQKNIKGIKMMKKRYIVFILMFILLIIFIVILIFKNNNNTIFSANTQKNLASTSYITWTQAQQGTGWEYITSITGTSDGGVIGVGLMFTYSASTGVDVNGDGITEEFSLGNDDGIIVNYDSDGNLNWSKTFGGEYDDKLNKVVLTSDGGFVIVGYTSSYEVYYDGSKISELSIDTNNENIKNKDGILIKISSNGEYEWGIRIGGTYDDEIISVIETSDGNIAIVGRYYSNTFNFFDKGDLSTVKATIIKGSSYSYIMNGFLASYTSSGAYNWSQNISGTYDVEVIDITETTQGIAIGLNYVASGSTKANYVYLDTDRTINQAGTSSSYTNGLVVGYDLDGTYSWRYRFYASSSYNVAIGAISVGINDEIYVGVNYYCALLGGQNGATGDDLSKSTKSTYYAGTVIKLSNEGEYTETVFTIDGDYDDYISDIVGTLDRRNYFMWMVLFNI